MTTKKGIIHAVHAIHQRYRIDHMQLNKKRLNTQFSTDHVLTRTKPLERNSGAWIHTTGNSTVAFPYTKHSEVGDTLRLFSDDVGIPDILRTYLGPEIPGKHAEFQAQVKHLCIELTRS